MQPSAQRPPFLEKEKLGKKEKQNKKICWYFIAKKGAQPYSLLDNNLFRG